MASASASGRLLPFRCSTQCLISPRVRDSLPAILAPGKEDDFAGLVKTAFKAVLPVAARGYSLGMRRTFDACRPGSAPGTRVILGIDTGNVGPYVHGSRRLLVPTAARSSRFPALACVARAMQAAPAACGRDRRCLGLRASRKGPRYRRGAGRSSSCRPLRTRRASLRRS